MTKKEIRLEIWSYVAHLMMDMVGFKVYGWIYAEEIIFHDIRETAEEIIEICNKYHAWNLINNRDLKKWYQETMDCGGYSEHVRKQLPMPKEWKDLSVLTSKEYIEKYLRENFVPDEEHGVVFIERDNNPAQYYAGFIFYPFTVMIYGMLSLAADT